MRLFYLALLLLCACRPEAAPIEATATADPEPGVRFYVNPTVTNQDAPYFAPIWEQWQAYVSERNYLGAESPYWQQDRITVPEYAYISLVMDFDHSYRQQRPLQCTLLGLIPVEGDFYLLKTMYTAPDTTAGATQLRHIASVYAQQQADGSYRFCSGVQYHRAVHESVQVGEVEYLVHRDHTFDPAAAERMAAFNLEMATRFEMEPISYLYVVANNSTDLLELMGLDFFGKSYQAVQSGGMADPVNRIIYAGNNSEYYPHEVVHLYTGAQYRGQYHRWVDEGVATYFGGSTGYDIEWHLQKLKAFLADNPDFRFGTLAEMEKDIPNGEYTTDFRYVIGGYLMGQLYEREGMLGLAEALQAGSSDEAYYALLQEKLGIGEGELESYMRAEMQKLPEATEKEMVGWRY